MSFDTNSGNNFNVFVANTSGVCKGIELTKKKCTQKSLQNISSITENDVVTAMSWGNDDESEILLACGTKEIKCYKIYDTLNKKFVKEHSCDVGKGKIIGISKYEGNIVTAAESGHVKFWNDEKEEKLLVEAGENLNRMRHSLQNNVIATGGEENPLKLYDLQTGKQTFIAKNVPHDSLQLRIPISIRDIGFFSDNQQKIVTVGKFGHVRTYDLREQRRPVINFEMKDEALNTLCVVPGKEQILVGSGKGRMKLVDLRIPGKELSVFKGAVGSITSIACSMANPCVVSVGLDRYLRVHNIDTKEEIRKVYLTSKTTCMLLKSEFSLEEDEKMEEPLENGDKMPQDYEDLFDEMDEVGKRKRTNPNGQRAEKMKKNN